MAAFITVAIKSPIYRYGRPPGISLRSAGPGSVSLGPSAGLTQGPVTVRGSENRYWSEYLHRYMLSAAQVTAEGRRTSAAIVPVDGSTRPKMESSDELAGQVHFAACGLLVRHPC